MVKKKFPLLCRLGIHRTFWDVAFFAVAKRCDRGDHWVDPEEGARVELVRELLSAHVPLDKIVDRVGATEIRIYRALKKEQEAADKEF